MSLVLRDNGTPTNFGMPDIIIRLMSKAKNVKSFIDLVNKMNGPLWLIRISLPFAAKQTIEATPSEPVRIDLNFWFSKKICCAETPTVDLVLQNPQIVTEETDINILESFVDKIRTEASQWANNSGIFYLNFRTRFDNAREIVYRKIMELTLPIFKENLIMTKDEIVNGYALYDCTENIMDSGTYQHLLNLLNDESPRLNYEDFVSNTGFCSDWNKCNLVNDDPVDFGDANWWDVTFEKNARAVWNLPFHTSFLKKTISIGCSNRQESPRYCNFLGVWIQRKTAQMNALIRAEIRSLNREEFNPLASLIADYCILAH